MNTAASSPVLGSSRDGRPAAGAGRRGNGGTAARRAVVRWAWRLFRREWRQQLLILVLLTVAVGATTAGLAAATNSQPAARTTLTLPGSDPDLPGDLAALQQRYGPLPVTDHVKVDVPGSVAAVDLRAPDPAGRPLSFRVVDGRSPAAAGEVATTRTVAAVLDIRVGGTWSGAGRPMSVVGLVENSADLNDQFVLAAPGQVAVPDSVTVALPTSFDRFDRVRLPSRTPVQIAAISSTAKAAAAAAVLALSTFGLLFVGLLSVAGFTVMAQRRLRSLGMLGSLGATDRHVRLVLLAHGVIVGASAALTGGAVGVAGWLVLAPRLESATGHRIDRFDLPWWAVGLSLALAIATSVGAAWWPARAASRTSVMAALSSRPPRPRPAHRFAALGAVLLASGVVLLDLAHERRPLLVVAGIVTTVIGVLLLAPLAIRTLAAAGPRAPVAVRLAMRDLARYQARSAAALGAITLAVGIAATIVVSAAYQASVDAQTAGNLAANQLVAYASDPSGPVPELAPAAVVAARTGVDAMAAALGTHSVLELDRPIDPNGFDLNGPRGQGKEPVAMVDERPLHGGVNIELIAAVYVATPAVLQRYGITPSQVDADVDVLTSRSDLGGKKLGIGPRDTFVPKLQRVDLPPYTSAPNTLMTTSAVDRLGLRAVPSAWLIEAGHPLRAAQVGAARKTAAAAGLTIETRPSGSSLSRLAHQVTAAGIVLALGVLALTVGLIRSETAHELRTLTAAGASATTRRTLTAATSGALALLGAVLGVAGAYLALVAWHRSHLHPLVHVPVANVAVMLVGLPAAAAVGGWLLAGREPAAIARRPLD